jgi:hypothetical protein
MYFRQSVLALGVLACAWSAQADVTMVSQMKGKMMGMSPEGETITYIKGTKMRTDQTMGRDKTSTIMDVETGRMVTINHGKKEAEVWNMADLSASLQKSGMEVGAADVKIAPTGKSKEVAGYAAQEYEISVSVDAGVPDAPIKMTMTISGPSYLSTTAPGAQDYAHFYQTAAEKGFFFGDPRAAKAQPGRARGMMQMYRDMATKGIPLESVQTIKMSGSGPMAAIMSKMGGGEMQTTVTRISDETLDASLFEIPAGYKVKEQKVK